MKLRINDRIKTRTLEFFNQVSITLKYDAVASSFSVSYFFDINIPAHKEVSAPHYHLCTLEDNDEVLITGYIMSQAFNTSSKKQLVSLGGYSLPGFLDDCDISANAGTGYQSDGLNLRQIAEKYIAPFGIKMIIDRSAASAMEEPYDECTAKETQSPKSFLCELASQKNIIVSHDEKGNLRFTKALASQKSIFHFTEDTIGVTAMGFSFKGTGMHSEITVARQEDVEEKDVTSSKAVIKNPYVFTVYRPRTIIMSSTKDDDVVQAAKNALAKELTGMPFTIHMDRWTINEKIVRPGIKVSVTSPNDFIFKKTDFIVQEVQLKNDSHQKTAILTLVLPECFDGNIRYPEEPAVKYIFAGINLR